MKKETQVTKPSALSNRALELRLAREAEAAREFAKRKARRRLVLGGVLAAPVAFCAFCVWFSTVYTPPVAEAPAEVVIPTPTTKPASPAPAPEVKPEADPVGEWAVRAYEAQQAHQDRCWDQLEERGFGDASCY